MIEKTIRDYLTTKLSVPVYLEIPQVPGASYVVIEKTGSRRENMIETATLAIRSVAGTLYGAATLNESVKTHMDSARGTCPSVFRVMLNSDYNFTNTETKERRYQAVYNVTYKE